MFLSWGYDYLWRGMRIGRCTLNRGTVVRRGMQFSSESLIQCGRGSQVRLGEVPRGERHIFGNSVRVVADRHRVGSRSDFGLGRLAASSSSSDGQVTPSISFPHVHSTSVLQASLVAMLYGVAQHIWRRLNKCSRLLIVDCAT